MTPSLPYSWNASQADLGGGVRSTRIGLKWENYLDQLNRWRKIDRTFRQDSGRASVVHAPYLLDCPKYANGPIRFESTCRWDLWSKRVLSDQARGIVKQYFTARKVIGVLTAQGMLYAGAFPDLHADLLIQPHTGKVRHLIQFNAPPPGTGPVKIAFAVESDCDERPTWSPRGGFSFARGKGLRGVGFKQAHAWDSLGNRIRIRVVIRNMGGRWVCTKVIPRAFFEGKPAGTTFWADTDTTFYPDPDPETSSVDGEVGSQISESTFSDLRGSSGNAAFPSTNSMRASIVGNIMGSGYDEMWRSLMVFDTTTLPDSDTISAATLSLYCTEVTDNGSQAVCICLGTTVSNTTLSTGLFGSNAGNTTQFASDINISSLSTFDYNAFALNASGLANVSTTAVSKFMARLSGDRTNTDPSLSSNKAEAVFSTADEMDTVQDPKLEVTHVAGGGGSALLFLAADMANIADMKDMRG